MRPIRPNLALLAALALAACSGADQVTAVDPEAATPRLALAPACVEFNVPPLGTVFGAPIPNPPGAVVFVENGVKVSVNRFYDFALNPYYNWARIEMPPLPFGAGKTARSNNINIGFDYSALPFVPKAVRFRWLDLGGFENLFVNGVGPYVGELDAAAIVIAGITVTPNSWPVVGGDEGTITLSGGLIHKFQVGGQELWIDQVCAFP